MEPKNERDDQTRLEELELLLEKAMNGEGLEELELLLEKAMNGEGGDEHELAVAYFTEKHRAEQKSESPTKNLPLQHIEKVEKHHWSE